MKNRKKHGFTLIEMVVIVVIISILVSIALPKYFIAVEQARAAESVSILKAIYEAQQRYCLANNDWASNIANLDLNLSTLAGVHVETYFNFTTNSPNPYDSNDVWLVQASRNSVNRGSIGEYFVRINESGELYSDNPQIPVGVKYTY